MSNDLAELIAKRFIQRRDVKAMQSFNGNDYFPVTQRNPDDTPGPRLPFKMADLQDHLEGKRSYGHYLLDLNDTARLFAFDIDLERTGFYCELPDLSAFETGPTDEQFMSMVRVYSCNPQEVWRNRAHPGRTWMKFQMRSMADLLARTIYDVLELPTAAAYSGSKGVHVYGFTGPVKASEAREAADLVLDAIGEFEVKKGKNFFRHKNQDPFTGYPNISVEVFPKQESLSGKDLGNLMRLPLGRNIRSNDPTFFVDMKKPRAILSPHPDPVELLTSGNPWA